MTSKSQKKLTGEKDEHKKALLRYQGLKSLHSYYFLFFLSHIQATKPCSIAQSGMPTG